MNQLPLTPEIDAMARRVVWFEEPQQAISDPSRFLAYAMTYGDYTDIAIIQKYWTEDNLVEAISKAPAGIFDQRSWAYWNLKLGRYPTPPIPERPFDKMQLPPKIEA